METNKGLGFPIFIDYTMQCKEEQEKLVGGCFLQQGIGRQQKYLIYSIMKPLGHNPEEVD